jgi:hypothetical protein
MENGSVVIKELATGQQQTMQVEALTGFFG